LCGRFSTNALGTGSSKMLCGRFLWHLVPLKERLDQLCCAAFQCLAGDSTSHTFHLFPDYLSGPFWSVPDRSGPIYSLWLLRALDAFSPYVKEIRSYSAMPSGGARTPSWQQIHQRDLTPSPCVLRGIHSLYGVIADRNRTVSRRSELKSRILLMHEQCNPWKLLHLQDRTIQHRGRKHLHRYGLLEDITLLSLALLILWSQSRNHYKCGSLVPTFVPARRMGLAVKQTYALALYVWFLAIVSLPIVSLCYYLKGTRPK